MKKKLEPGKRVGLASGSPLNAKGGAPRAAKTAAAPAKRGLAPVEIRRDVNDAEVNVDGGLVKLTNLRKIFFPEVGLTKGDLLRYYVEVSPWLMPHIKNRAMVMKRYPNGATGEFFFMKRAPESRPETIKTCSVTHSSGNIIGFPVIQDLAALLWVINLGCIDLNPWYARCDAIDQPDYLHFDLDPTPEATFEQVLETALIVRDALDSLKIKNYAKTTGSRGIHVYVPIVRGPLQKRVWEFAKAFSKELEARNPKVITAEYKVARRPPKHVLVDYNQNAWGRTLASIYSVRPKPTATVSTPVTWQEVEKGLQIEDFTMRNVPERVKKLGDLWKPMVEEQGRVDLEKLL